MFLQAHGASPALAARIFKRYGPNAANVVSRAPYRLALDVWGVGFKTADGIAVELGIARDSPRRIEAGILQALRDARDSGHAYVPAERRASVCGRRSSSRSTPAEDPRRSRSTVSTDALALGGYVVPRKRSKGTAHRLHAAEMYAAEPGLAARLVELAESACADRRRSRDRRLREGTRVCGLAPEQRDAIDLGSARVGARKVTGGPGVGKTTIVRAILAMFDRAGLTVRLAAPTGRAAKRMTEATGREASTLHRLPRVRSEERRFKRDIATRSTRAPSSSTKASMIDLADGRRAHASDHARHARRPGGRRRPAGQRGARRRAARLHRVQRVACARLTRIFRQEKESLIVVNAHRIHDGEPPLVPEAGDERADFYVIDRRDPEGARKTILELVTSRIPRRFGLDPIRDVQVLAPMHRGPCGSLALNDALQAALNAEPTARPRSARRGLHQKAHGARVFREGDKVMQLRNDYDRNVWNGDVGLVARASKRRTGRLHRSLRRRLRRATGRAPRGLRAGARSTSLSLAYACSVHKSQGAEYPAVVVPLLDDALRDALRATCSTAVTRGKRLVVLVADPCATRASLALADDRRDEADGRASRRRIIEAPCLTC